jgi:hypothetical protein
VSAGSITVFGADQDGGRACQFERDGLTVLVRPSGAEQNADAHALAIALDSEASSLTLLDALLRETREKHAADVRSLLGRVPPKSPRRLLGPGFVRFDADGRPWVLGNREKGWAHFGFICDDWDDLFRRWNVSVTAHGTDKHGPWWQVENVKGKP